jgi:hypothetical protein
VCRSATGKPASDRPGCHRPDGVFRLAAHPPAGAAGVIQTAAARRSVWTQNTPIWTTLASIAIDPASAQNDGSARVLPRASPSLSVTPFADSDRRLSTA